MKLLCSNINVATYLTTHRSFAHMPHSAMQEGGASELDCDIANGIILHRVS